MNKSELITAIAEKSNLSNSDAEQALAAFVSTVTEALKNGDKISLIGFGSFSVNERKERKGHNPKTGAEITIPAAKVAKFSAGKALKESINS